MVLPSGIVRVGRVGRDWVEARVLRRVYTVIE